MLVRSGRAGGGMMVALMLAEIELVGVEPVLG